MKQMKTAILTAALVALLSLGSGAAPAQPQPQSAAPHGDFRAFGMALVQPRQAYRAFDDKPRLLPLLIYEGRWLRVAGPTLDLKLHEAAGLGWSLRSRIGFDGYEAEDSPALAGMARRKDGLWLGAAAQWKHQAGWSLSAEWLADAGGNSKGRQLRLQLAHAQRLGGLTLSPRLGLLREDRRHVDFYYGVRADEALADRPVYRGAASLSLELGLRLDHALGAQGSLFADLGLTRLGAGIRHSPLVERGQQGRLSLGYLHRF